MGTMWRKTGWVLGLLLGACPKPPGIDPVDSGVNVDPDLIKPGSPAQFRFGNFVAGAGPVDLCLAKNGGDWVGPLARLKAQRTGGVYYQNFSQYMEMDAGSYTVRAVPGNRSDCTVQYGGIPDMPMSALGEGRTYSLAPLGELAKPLGIKIKLFEDSLSAQGGQVRVRFVNLSPDVPSADFGLGQGGNYTPTLIDAVSGDLGRQNSAVYVAISPQTGGAVTVRASGTSNVLWTTATGATLGAGAVYTLLISGLAARTAPDPLALKFVACEDNKVPQSGLTACANLN